MSKPRALRRLAGLALLGAVLLAGCSSGGTDNSNPGTIALALNPGGGTVVQGGQTITHATLIRGGGFTGTVNLTVTGNPAGVTATVTNVVTTGTTTTATVTIAVGATTATGAYSLVLHGAGTGVSEATATYSLTVDPAPAPSFTLALTPAPFDLAQNATPPVITVNLARTNFTAGITLTVEGLPNGVTATFGQNPVTGTSTTLTLSNNISATTGVINLTVRATAAGLTDRTAPLAITVTAPAANFTLTTTPATSATVTQGASTPVTVNINRTGGNTSDVALTATGTLPAGMTLGFAPSSTTTNSSVLTITTTGATPVGATPIVIHGNATGLGEQLVNLTINVVAPGGSGNVTVSFTACTANEKPVWLAFQDGVAGAWTPATGVADVYQFNIAQAKGGVAWVALGTGTSSIQVQYFSQAELTAGTLTLCGLPDPFGNKTVNGTVANLPAGLVAQISFANSGTIAAADGPFQLHNAVDGPFDLVAYAHPSGGQGIADRIFVSRGENPAAAGNFSTAVDFLSATKSAPPAVGSGTITGLTGSETGVFQTMTFFTGGTVCAVGSLYVTATAAASFNFYGMPPSLRVGGDMHSLGLSIQNGNNNFRHLQETFFDVATRALTPFVAPAQLPLPVVTDLGGPYKRPNAVITGVPAEFDLVNTMSFQDQTTTGKTGTVSASKAWVGSQNVTLALPNFAGVGSFDVAWAPATGDAINWSVTVQGGTLTSACGAGQRTVSGSRFGSLP